MELRDLFAPGAVDLDLQSRTKSDALREMVWLLQYDGETTANMLRILRQREATGSTGVGRGIAFPHCRCPLVPDLRLAYGRVPQGLPYDAIDGRPVFHLFLIVAPLNDPSNQYLPVLRRLAQFVKDPCVPDRLAQIATPDEFLALLDERRA